MSKLIAALLLSAAILMSGAVAAFADSGEGNAPGVDKYVPGDQQLQIAPAQSGQ